MGNYAIWLGLVCWRLRTPINLLQHAGKKVQLDFLLVLRFYRDRESVEIWRKGTMTMTVLLFRAFLPLVCYYNNAVFSAVEEEVEINVQCAKCGWMEIWLKRKKRERRRLYSRFTTIFFFCWMGLTFFLNWKPKSESEIYEHCYFISTVFRFL